MRDCEDGAMRDLLPGYVNAALSEAEHAKVEAHLRTCADCAAEIELIEAAGRAYPAAKIDVDRIVKALPAAPRVSRRPFFASRIGQLAAAIGIVAIGAISVLALRGFFGGDSIVIVTGSRIVSAPPVVKPAPVPAAGTTRAVAAATPSPTPAAASRPHSISFGGGLDDLSDEQLAALLSELDTLEALPSTEPETHLSPIVPEADGGHNARETHDRVSARMRNRARCTDDAARTARLGRSRKPRAAGARTDRAGHAAAAWCNR